MAVARSPLVALRYAMYFRFINDVMFAHNGQKLAKKAFSKLLTSTDLTPQTTLKVTHQGQHRTGDGVCYLRVAFKLIATVHRCLNGRAPNYLLNRVIPVSAIVSRQRLRFAQQNTLVVPRYRLTTYGRRAFSVAGPTAWNSLPVSFRDPTISDACFRRHLKTVLFAQQRRHHSV